MTYYIIYIYIYHICVCKYDFARFCLLCLCRAGMGCCKMKCSPYGRSSQHCLNVTHSGHRAVLAIVDVALPKAHCKPTSQPTTTNLGSYLQFISKKKQPKQTMTCRQAVWTFRALASSTSACGSAWLPSRVSASPRRHAFGPA